MAPRSTRRGPNRRDQQRVDLRGEDQAGGVHPEDDGVGAGGHAVDVLQHERRAGDVGEQRRERQPADQHQRDEGAVAQQAPVRRAGWLPGAPYGGAARAASRAGRARPPTRARTRRRPGRRTRPASWSPRARGHRCWARGRARCRSRASAGTAAWRPPSRRTGRARWPSRRRRRRRPTSPCRSLAPVSRAMLGARAQSTEANRWPTTPAISGRRRPTASESGPMTSWPTPRPTSMPVIVAWAADSVVARSAVRFGRAGRYMSIVSGPSAVSEPRTSTSCR